MPIARRSISKSRSLMCARRSAARVHLAVRDELLRMTFCEPADASRCERQPQHKLLLLLLSSGAGEGIRTLDPNLGKVVLYP